MSNLNDSWLAIIIFGIIFLVGSLIFTVFQSITGANSDFRQTITPFEKTELLSDRVENHIE